MELNQSEKLKDTTKSENKRQVRDQISQKDSFQSFDSNNKQNQQTITQHKQKMVTFPAPTAQLLQYYNIFQKNAIKISRLKNQIHHFSENYHQSQILNYQEQSRTIEEFIDIDQQSQYYLKTKELYQERKKQLIQISKKYEEVKTAHIEALMMKDEVMQKAVHVYLQQYCEVISHILTPKEVVIITKENFQKIKIKASCSKIRIPEGVKKKQFAQNEEEEVIKNMQKRQELDKKQNNNDKKEVQGQKIQAKLKNPNQKFFIRKLPYSRLISYISDDNCPLPVPLLLPKQLQDIEGIVYNPISKQCGIIQSYDVNFLDEDNNLTTISIDNKIKLKIIFCDFRDKYFYIGSNDGVLRVYQYKSPVQYQIHNVYACYGKGMVSNFILHSDSFFSIMFICEGTFIYQMDLQSYNIRLLSQLAEKITLSKKNIICTENMIYTNYFRNNKIILQHSDKIKKIVNQRKVQSIVGIYQNTQLNKNTLVVYQGNGYYYARDLQ